MGRVPKADGGISEVSIRNKTGEHFRLLIDAWASKANTSMKKPPVSHSRKNKIPTEMELLKQLDDPVMRVIFGQVIIDMRPNHNISVEQVHQGIQVLSSLDSLLLLSDAEALKDAINEDKMAQHGWTCTKIWCC